MSIASQSVNPESTLRRFLDTRLPTRHAVVERWHRDLQDARWTGVPVDGDRACLGRALELRLGLDLGERPAYWDLLAFLPARRCAELLQAAGFSSSDVEDLPEARTDDPMLQSWIRRTRPAMGDTAERAALTAVLDAASWDRVAHQLNREWSVQDRRALSLAMRANTRDRGADTGSSTSMVDALTHLWSGYLTHGRQPLLALGQRVLLEPDLVPGFARADIVIGRTLVEVKCSAEPGQHLQQWLDQLLGYVLIDRWNSLYLDRIAVYSAWHAMLLAEPLDRLLRNSRAAAPELSVLRDQFNHEIRDDLEEAALWRDRARFPLPGNL